MLLAVAVDRDSYGGREKNKEHSTDVEKVDTETLDYFGQLCPPRSHINSLYLFGIVVTSKRQRRCDMKMSNSSRCVASKDVQPLTDSQESEFTANTTDHFILLCRE